MALNLKSALKNIDDFMFEKAADCILAEAKAVREDSRKLRLSDHLADFSVRLRLQDRAHDPELRKQCEFYERARSDSDCAFRSICCHLADIFAYFDAFEAITMYPNRFNFLVAGRHRDLSRSMRLGLYLYLSDLYQKWLNCDDSADASFYEFLEDLKYQIGFYCSLPKFDPDLPRWERKACVREGSRLEFWELREKAGVYWRKIEAIREDLKVLADLHEKREAIEDARWGLIEEAERAFHMSNELERIIQENALTDQGDL